MKTSPHISSANIKQRLADLLHLHHARQPQSKMIYLLIALTIISVLYLMFSPTRRYAVLAGYNAEGKVPAYTVDYLKGLKEITDGIVYITDSPLRPEEQKKIKPYVLYSEHVRHGEYDWGSYKRGFNWLKKNGYLKKANELILANDSTYAPLKSFKPMFKTMALRPELDFWGNTQNSKFIPHLQSYFLVFRRPTIRSKSFAMFLNNVKPQIDHSLFITEYEIKLTRYLAERGYKWDSYIPNFPTSAEISDPNSYPVTSITKHDSQFLKRRTFTEKLPILENKKHLLSWLKKFAPKTYAQIEDEFLSQPTVVNQK